MKTLRKNFTTPEQSKRLLELGVPEDSADCVYDCALIGGDKYYSLNILEDELFSAYKRIWEDPCTDIIPCWSVGRLIEIENICSIPKIKEAGFHLLAQDFDDLIETMIISIKMKVEHYWIDFSKLKEEK